MDQISQNRSFGTNLRNKQTTAEFPHKPSAAIKTTAHQLSRKQKLERWKKRKESSTTKK